LAAARAKKHVFYGASTSRKFGYSSESLSTYNKYTNADYDYFEDSWANTLAGNVLDRHIAFVVGGGVKPVFELVKSKGLTQQQIAKKLETFDDLKAQLQDLDAKPTIALKQTVQESAAMAKTFGRCVIAYEPEGVQIPEALYIIHPRDLGRPYLRQDYSLSSVFANELNSSIAAEDMMYVVNKPRNPLRKHVWYGFSEMQRVVGAARALRRIIEYDSPEIVESLWAKYGIIIANTEGKTAAQAQVELQRIADGMKPGAFNVINGKPNDDIQYIDTQMSANVGDLVKLVDNYERLIIGNWGIPGPLLGRETESNMATLFGKIRLYLAGPVASDREWLGEIIGKQWYERNVRRIDPEALKEIRIKAEFEPVVIESWVDLVPAAVQLQQLYGDLPVEVSTTLLHLEHYKDLLSESKQKADAQKQQAKPDALLQSQQRFPFDGAVKEREVKAIEELRDFVTKGRKHGNS